MSIIFSTVASVRINLMSGYRQKSGLLISVFFLLFLLSCQSVDGVEPISTDIDPSLPPTKLNDSTTRVSATPLPQPSNLVTQTRPPMNAVSTIPPSSAEREATTTPPPTKGLGWLFFARYEYYGWFELVAEDSPFGLILDETDEYNKFTSRDLFDGPGQGTYHVFSHYSDQIAYWTATSPEELWVSDATYQEPQKVLTDSEKRYTPESGNLLSVDEYLEIAWSPDDLHLFIFNRLEPKLSQIYNLETGVLEDWYWYCDSLILSSQSDRLATLCHRFDGVSKSKEAYAVLEWGGEIWFSNTLPGDVFLEPTTDGTVFWQWSADGELVAYFDPSDRNGHFFITDALGNIRRLLPGSSLYKDSEIEGYQQYEFLNSETPFLWARDKNLILVNGFGSPDEPCPPLVSEEFDPPQAFVWPCWQAVDINTGNIIWSETRLAESLSLQDQGVIVSMSIGDVAVEPNGRAIAVYTTYMHPRIVVIDLETSQATTVLMFDRIRNIHWGSNLNN